MRGSLIASLCFNVVFAAMLIVVGILGYQWKVKFERAEAAFMGMVERVLAFEAKAKQYEDRFNDARAELERIKKRRNAVE